ncbi:hypothetical protein [Vibrio salinus]|uniref:hypothetical protein n=1 Tax=Vibrio salinus TaxID=2899784 RepID=UPI001E57DC1C|nr:hypothetical protein [Vibrio salinus]MCE0494140.1 hypothetical protein [Vibrio salinus]
MLTDISLTILNKLPAIILSISAMMNGLFETFTRVPFPSYKELTRATLILWLLLFCGLIYKHFPDVLAMDLKDNDDFMRYVQFTTWLKNGHWYLEPIPQFNPQDGVLFHWSRVPDFLLAGITLLCHLFLPEKMSEAIAMSAVPPLYFVIFLFAIGTFTYRIFGPQYTFTAVVFAFASMVIGKFLPGSIDHHNIQLMLAALFLTQTPFHRYECKKKNHAMLQGIILGVSFWVGIENIIFFVSILTMLTLFGYFHSLRYLFYVQRLCASAIISCAVFIPLNRPVSEYFSSRVDSLSIAYLVSLCCGYLFCRLSVYVLKQYKKNRVLVYLLIGLLSVFPIILWYPEIILGVYYQYPPELNRFWLSHVIEAKSTLDYMSSDGILNDKNYILPLLPAFLSILFIHRKDTLFFVYILFLVLAIPFIFWQIRTNNITLLIAIPLQAFFVIRCCSRFHSAILKILTTLLLSPLILALLFSYLNDILKDESPAVTKSLTGSEIIALINRHHISNGKILAPLDYGAKIIALTNNQVIAAPYHRNIRGNRLAVQLFTSTNQPACYQKLKANHINYIMFGPYSASRIFSIYSDKDALINQLYNGHIPPWLTLIEHTENGFFLFKVNNNDGRQS